MKPAPLGLIAVLFAPALSGQDVAEILRRVSEKYTNANQYRFEMRKSGEESGTLKIAVLRPNRFRLEADGRVIDGADAFDKMTMVGDGASAWNFIPEPPQYTKKKITLPLLDTEPPAVSPETFVLQADVVFLSRYARLAAATDHAKLVRADTDSYVIELHAPLPGFRDTYTWWVDRKRYVVVREDTQPASNRRPVSSVVYSLASIDEPIPQELFHFSPPAGAKQVEQLEP
jgi:outer membrane lipoprotein-sorting protein